MRHLEKSISNVSQEQQEKTTTTTTTTTFKLIERDARVEKRKEVGFLKKDFLTQTSCDKKNYRKTLYWIFLNKQKAMILEIDSI